jgi:hypothetical protein
MSGWARQCVPEGAEREDGRVQQAGVRRYVECREELGGLGMQFVERRQCRVGVSQRWMPQSIRQEVFVAGTKPQDVPG